MKSRVVRMMLTAIILVAVASNNSYGREDNVARQAKKTAKTLTKDGWKVHSWAANLEDQLKKLWELEIQTDETGAPVFISVTTIASDTDRESAKLKALELARVQISGRLGTSVSSIVESRLEEAAETQERSLGKSHHRLGSLIPVVECFRVLENNMIEYRISVVYAYNNN